MKSKTQIKILWILLIFSLFMHLKIGFVSAEQFEVYEFQIERQAAQIKDKQEQIEVLEIMLENQKQDASEVVDEPEYIGTFTVTAYCSCEICCGEYALNRPNGIVYGAAGVELQEGVSVASPLPLGTELFIDGQKYINHDRTAKWIEKKYDGMIIDKYFENHEDAKAFGKQIAEVYLGG